MYVCVCLFNIIMSTELAQQQQLIGSNKSAILLCAQNILHQRALTSLALRPQARKAIFKLTFLQQFSLKMYVDIFFACTAKCLSCSNQVLFIKKIHLKKQTLNICPWIVVIWIHKQNCINYDNNSRPSGNKARQFLQVALAVTIFMSVPRLRLLAESPAPVGRYARLTTTLVCSPSTNEVKIWWGKLQNKHGYIQTNVTWVGGNHIWKAKTNVLSNSLAFEPSIGSKMLIKGFSSWLCK